MAEHTCRSGLPMSNRNIGVSFSKGKINLADEGVKSYKLDDAFSVLDNVKGTPRYHKKHKMEMLGKIDNFGPFHWFYTLSCADMRWEENFSSILREKGYKIIWKEAASKIKPEVEDVETYVKFMKDGEEKEFLLKYFLENECDESLHEFIRTNVFIATRNFIHRVQAFRTEIMMGKNNPLAIKYFSDKMEYQGRGAGHIHGVAWSDLRKVSELIEKEREVGVILSSQDKDSDISHLENAYQSLQRSQPLIEVERDALIDFIDRAVTCTLNPEMAAKMIDVNKDKVEGIEIIKIAEDCLIHRHTKSCRKYGTNCRVNFPRYPMWKTELTREMVEDDEEKKKAKKEKHTKILVSVMDILEDEEKIKQIMDSYDKQNESIGEYKFNRKERIEKVLELAKVDKDEYLEAVLETSRKGISVVLARDIDEIYVNNYNPEWLEAWDGNIDIQPVFDFFAVITYVTEYFTKDESGTTSFLAEASKQIKALPIKDQQRSLKHVFLTHRQMGISEAFMKILPEITLKNSNIGTEFVCLGKKEDISRYLMRADEDLEYFDKELFEVEGKEGLYYEKPNWIEKYQRRDMIKYGELSPVQYLKMFDPTNKGPDEKSENQEEEHLDEEDNTAENEMQQDKDTSEFERVKKKYGAEVKFHCLVKQNGELGDVLPNYMCIENTLPGEPKFLQKRRIPKALRFFKPKRDINPSRYFLHELMLYRCFDKNDYERWRNDY